MALMVHLVGLRRRVKERTGERAQREGEKEHKDKKHFVNSLGLLATTSPLVGLTCRRSGETARRILLRPGPGRLTRSMPQPPIPNTCAYPFAPERKTGIHPDTLIQSETEP